MLTPPELWLGKNVLKIARRNIGILAPALQKASDPIQQLFLDKIREYKSKVASGQVDRPAELLKQEEAETLRVATQLGVKPTEANDFPHFKFEEKPVDLGIGEKHEKVENQQRVGELLRRLIT